MASLEGERISFEEQCCNKKGLYNACLLPLPNKKWGLGRDKSVTEIVYKPGLTATGKNIKTGITVFPPVKQFLSVGKGKCPGENAFSLNSGYGCCNSPYSSLDRKIFMSHEVEDINCHSDDLIQCPTLPSVCREISPGRCMFLFCDGLVLVFFFGL